MHCFVDIILYLHPLPVSDDMNNQPSSPFLFFFVEIVMPAHSKIIKIKMRETGYYFANLRAAVFNLASPKK